MPQLCPESAAKPSRRHSPRSGVSRRRGPPLSILAIPSPNLGDTCTTHNEMLFWVGWFARFHSDGLNHVPYEIKTLDRPVVGMDGLPRLHSDGQPQKMRCVREIVRHDENGTASWTMLAWDVGKVSVTFHPCASLDEAMTLYNAPPSPIRMP